MTQFNPKDRAKITWGAMGLPIKPDASFLLTQINSPSNSTAHLKWGLTGGVIEYTESPPETLIREFKEELGVKPRIIFPYPQITSHIWPTGSHVILITYLVSLDGQIPNPDRTEISSLGWFALSDLKNLDLMPNVRQIASTAASLVQPSTY